jgi:hypothetical protein
VTVFPGLVSSCVVKEEQEPTSNSQTPVVSMNLSGQRIGVGMEKGQFVLHDTACLCFRHRFLSVDFVLAVRTAAPANSCSSGKHRVASGTVVLYGWMGGLDKMRQQKHLFISLAFNPRKWSVNLKPFCRLVGFTSPLPVECTKPNWNQMDPDQTMSIHTHRDC